MCFLQTLAGLVKKNCCHMLRTTSTFNVAVGLTNQFSPCLPINFSGTSCPLVDCHHSANGLSNALKCLSVGGQVGCYQDVSMGLICQLKAAVGKEYEIQREALKINTITPPSLLLPSPVKPSSGKVSRHAQLHFTDDTQQFMSYYHNDYRSAKHLCSIVSGCNNSNKQTLCISHQNIKWLNSTAGNHNLSKLNILTILKCHTDVDSGFIFLHSPTSLANCFSAHVIGIQCVFLFFNF